MTALEFKSKRVCVQSPCSFSHTGCFHLGWIVCSSDFHREVVQAACYRQQSVSSLIREVFLKSNTHLTFSLNRFIQILWKILRATSQLLFSYYILIPLARIITEDLNSLLQYDIEN